MSLSREELKAQYKHLILERNAGTEKELFSTRCSNFLSKNKISDCFTLLPITAAQRDFLDKTEGRKDVEFRHLAKVFGLFEKYAVNILDKPWHKELKTIKVYTGFFKYNFEQWLSLDTVYKIFNLIGYQKTPNHTLTIGTTDGERLLVIAFELYLAHNQLCTFKGNVDLCSKYSMQDIFEGWSNTTGNLNDIQEWLIRQIATKDEDHSYKTLYEHMRPVTVIDETMRLTKMARLWAFLLNIHQTVKKTE
ncbi:uncharacterized protein LOC114540187 [Dendronephthya gigantea]|uniref:uncharacterized protein LOC114540187 n=1 Tax=Dendronephthya gigantea TaxID=151771 RepID=UPI001069A429|nr:uncharacterized protein LOC114540187 [Dendronephthya gigantea]